MALDPPRHLQLFNRDTLAALVMRAGFTQSAVSSTLRTTSLVFCCSRLIHRSGRGRPRPLPNWSEALYGRVAALVELLMLMWDPLAADELLLEARK
jgi:hypothetical protein